MNENRKRLGSLSLLLLILYGCVVIYFVLFSDRLGRGDGYSTYRYNLVPFEEIRRFIIYRNYVSAGAFLLNLFGNLLVFFPIGFLVPIWRLEKTGCIRIIIYAFLFSLCIETLQLITKGECCNYIGYGDYHFNRFCDFNNIVCRDRWRTECYWGINWLYPHDSCIFLCSLGRNELR